MERKKIIVIGGGFAGLNLIRKLKEDLFDVLLIDKLNHHQFQPLFYQVATSQIEPSTISFPLRKIFHNRKNMQIRMAEVQSINPAANTVHSSIGDFPYDHLVIASGCKTNFYGNQELMKYSYSLKSTYDAIKLRNAVLENFEKLLSASEDEKESLLNIVIVGAGPTGVELAGSFAEIKKNVLPKDFPLQDFKDMKIILLEGGPATLGRMSELAKKASNDYLTKMGVEITTSIVVKEYDGNTVTLSDGQKIKSKNVIWTAGVSGNIIPGLDERVVMANGRFAVSRHNLIQGYKNIFAIGDIAYMETPIYPKGHPQLANVAIGQGKNLAKNLNGSVKNKMFKSYEYTNLGTMATIGKNKAVVDLPFLNFKGYLAWFVWMFLHLMLILSVKNKLIVFIEWAWNYVTKDSSLRLILKESDRK